MAKVIGITNPAKVIGVSSPAKVMGVTNVIPPATQSRLQGTINSGGDNITITSAPFPSNVTAGTLLLATVSQRNSETVPTVSDSKGNSWANILWNTQAATNTHLGLYWAVNTHGAGANTLSISYGGGSTTGGVILEEFLPSKGVPAIDGYNGYARGDFATGTDTVYSNTFNTTTNGDLIYSSVIMWKSGGATPTYGTGFTGLQNVAPGYFCGFFRVASESRIQTTAGSIQGTFGFTEAGGSMAGNCLAAAFKA